MSKLREYFKINGMRLAEDDSRQNGNETELGSSKCCIETLIKVNVKLINLNIK